MLHGCWVDVGPVLTLHIALVKRLWCVLYYSCVVFLKKYIIFFVAVFIFVSFLCYTKRVICVLNRDRRKTRFYKPLLYFHKELILISKDCGQRVRIQNARGDIDHCRGK